MSESSSALQATNLLERFGFTGDRLTARVGDLSGGERRRLQVLRLLMGEPNVLLLDEPTNDLDIDTLQVIEDHLDRWPGTLVVVSHDRYFLERVCDTVYGLPGDGSLVMLPGGVDDLFSVIRRSAPHGLGARGPSGLDEPLYGRDPAGGASEDPTRPADHSGSSPVGFEAARRQARRDIARIERQIARLEQQERGLHEAMAASAADFVRLGELQRELDGVLGEKAALEDEWLHSAEVAG